MTKKLKRFISIFLCSIFAFSYTALADTGLAVEEQGINEVATKIVIVRAATGEAEEYKVNIEEPRLIAPRVGHTFNWSIPANNYTYSASSFYMNVGDKIYFTNVSYPSTARVGLRNNATGTVNNWCTIPGNYFSLECLITGTYHFAFSNTSSSMITVSGSYEW